MRPSNEVIANGISAVEAFYKQQSEIYGYEIKPSYEAMNRIAYNALNKKEFTKAISIFKENVKRYPHKADAYDSLAEGYESAGELDKALDMRSLVIKKSIIENVEYNAYKTRLINLKKLMNNENP